MIVVEKKRYSKKKSIRLIKFQEISFRFVTLICKVAMTFEMEKQQYKKKQIYMQYFYTCVCVKLQHNT